MILCFATCCCSLICVLVLPFGLYLVLRFVVDLSDLLDFADLICVGVYFFGAPGFLGFDILVLCVG